MENSDLLDFPGARTRLAIEEDGIANEDNQKQMLIRGKVSYFIQQNILMITVLITYYSVITTSSWK